MLTNEDNELLTRVSGGAPMGEMMKSHFWIPAAISHKLVAGGAPLRVQLFGDRYVLFRAHDGRVGCFDEACPHRGASLALARNEDNALTCIYHGWKFRVDGVTVAVPTQTQNEAAFCERVPLRHFPVREAAGAIWVWLGPGDGDDKFQPLECMNLPAGHTVAFRQKVACNWLQGVETTMDSAHLGVLHQSATAGHGEIQLTSANQAPVYHLAEKDYGFRYASVRALADGRSYVRTNSFVLPWYGVISPRYTSDNGGNLFFSVPIDDENIWYWHIAYRIDAPLDPAEPRLLYRDADDWPPNAPGNEDNNWGQDRDAMARGHFTGFPQALGTEDFAVILSQGPIVDRTREFLGSGDGAVIAVRRALLKSVREFMSGQTPTLAQHDAISYESIQPRAVVCNNDDEWRNTL